MKIRRQFPLGKAYGMAFCNRVDETSRFISYIGNGTHVYLVAPRRYGKSSLCEHVLESTTIPLITLDFHLAVTEKNAEHIIINGVSNLIGKAIGPIDKLQHVVKKYVKKLQPKIALGSDHMKLELAFDEHSNPAENIAEALLLLEKLLQERNKQAVLLLDEFQEIGHMEKERGIEGAIRHVAQETQNLSIIFSGSNPHMLTSMFEDERRPLYKLCRKVTLDRIHAEDYRPHLNKAALSTWKKELAESVFEKIMGVTERHPYYVNYLCDELWRNDKSPPTLNNVDDAWDMIVEEEKSDLIKDFFSLSDNQRKILIYIANFGGNALYASEVANKTEIPSGSIATTLSILIEKNYIEKQNGVFRIIVPAYNKLLSTTII